MNYKCVSKQIKQTNKQTKNVEEHYIVATTWNSQYLES